MYIKNVKGVYLVNKNGFGFVRPFVFGDEDGSFDNSDIFIPPTQTGGAFNGDVVLCNLKSVSDIRNNNSSAVFVHASCEFSYAGKIISVEKRLKYIIVGNVISSGKKMYIMPDDYVPGRVLLTGDGVPALDGDKVLARIKSISSEGVVKATVEQNLGSSKDFEANLKAIKLSDSIGFDFPREAENQSEKFCMEHVSRFANRRLDLRGRTLFTMEGFGKYAYSCAFSVEINRDGNYVLGVHVPDVAHYIPEGSAIDKEAAKRGRACNLMGKVYPMIPKGLVEKKLSLKKGIDVLAVSFLLTIDADGNIIDKLFAETIINVSANCRNSEMEALLLNADTSALSDVRLLYKPVQAILDRAYALGAILQNARIQRGGLDIDEYRNRFVYVEKDEVPIELKRVIQNDPNRLVNEFYLVCEKALGEFFFEHNIPTIYCGFSKPSKEKLSEIEEYAINAGVETSSSEDPEFLQKLCASVMGTNAEEVVLEKLSHSLANLNTSKTSLSPVFNCIQNSDKVSPVCFPTLRYTDLTVQRIIKMIADYDIDKIPQSRINEIKELAINSVESVLMSNAYTNNAEQASYDLFGAEYFKNNVGKTFTGYLSAIGESKAFVLLKNGCIGHVPFNYYKDLKVTRPGKSLNVNGTDYFLGQKVSVAVVDADLGQRVVNFVFD